MFSPITKTKYSPLTRSRDKDELLKLAAEYIKSLWDRVLDNNQSGGDWVSRGEDAFLEFLDSKRDVEDVIKG